MAAAATAATPTTLPAVAVAVTPDAAVAAEPAVGWQELDRQINTDPQMSPADLASWLTTEIPLQ